jgi:hypothetical protein
VESSLVITTLNRDSFFPSSNIEPSSRRHRNHPQHTSLYTTQSQWQGKPSIPPPTHSLSSPWPSVAPRSPEYCLAEKREWPHFLPPQPIANHGDPTAGFTAKTVFPTIRNCSSKAARSTSDNGTRYVSDPPFRELSVRKENG